jgi:N-acetylglutamate synthase-like GNAT family acetyltransferase
VSEPTVPRPAIGDWQTAADSRRAVLRRASMVDLDAVYRLQRDAYAANRLILGVEPLPLTANYRQRLETDDVWVVEIDANVAAVLVLVLESDCLLVWSVATAPALHGCGLGRRLLTHAEAEARRLGYRSIRLYTGEKLHSNIAWYARHGYAFHHREELPDRSIVHLVKTLE